MRRWEENLTMKRRIHQSSRLAAGVLFAMLFVLLGTAHGKSSGSDEIQIRSVLDEYRLSVDTLDPALISEVWSSDLPVSFIHPLGTDENLDQIKADIFGKVMGMFSKRDLNFDTTAIHLNGDSAWIEITWTFHAVWKDTGEPLTTQGRETQVMVREKGAWRLVHVHYSGLPTTIVRKGV